jgi:hypothetical protein
MQSSSVDWRKIHTTYPLVLHQSREYLFRYFTDSELGMFETVITDLGNEGWELVQIVSEQFHRPIDWQGELPVAVLKRARA